MRTELVIKFAALYLTVFFIVVSAKIKVNNVPIATSNIPATNGVIHAVDDLVLSY